jgi:glutaredoxin
MDGRPALQMEKKMPNNQDLVRNQCSYCKRTLERAVKLQDARQRASCNYCKTQNQSAFAWKNWLDCGGVKTA